MIGRAVWALVVASVAVVTAGVQLDRQSRYVPTLSKLVPETFRGFSQRHITAQALLEERDALALEEARRLVARRPMPAEHLRLLSLAEFNANEAEQGVYSIQLAARRGWRDRTSQLTMFQLALTAGDEAEAARRFAALFVRRSEEEIELRTMANQLFTEGTAQATDTFAQIVTGADRWHAIYLQKAPIVLPPATLLDVTRQAVAGGADFDCDLVDQAAKRLARTNAPAADAFREVIPNC